MKSIEEEFLTNVVEDKTKNKRKKGINSKKKGNKGELELVHILNERFKDYTFARTVSSGAYTGGMNQHRAETLTEDQRLVFSGDIRVPTNFKFVIEHKFYSEASFWDLFNKSSDLYAWYEQSETDAKNVGKEPLLIVKYNNHKRIVFINVEFLVKSGIKNKKGITSVFIHENKACFWLEDVLKLDDEFFFDKKG